MVPALMVCMLDMLLSACLGFIHGGVLGYFVGGLNAAMLLACFIVVGVIIGSEAQKKSLKKWAEKDDEIVKEDLNL